MFQKQFTVMGKIRERERMTTSAVQLRKLFPGATVRNLQRPSKMNPRIRRIRRRCVRKTGITWPEPVAYYLAAVSQGNATFGRGIALSIDSLRRCIHHYSAKDL